MYDPMANSLYYINRGKCPQCSEHRPLEPGFKRCAECGAFNRAKSRARYELRRSAGLCVKCGAPTEGGRAKCPACMAKVRNDKKNIERRKRDYHRLKDAGKCVRCGERWAEPGKTMCRQCNRLHAQEHRRYDPDASKQAERFRRRKEAGLCVGCGKPAAQGRTRCERCLKKARESQQKYAILKKIEAAAEAARRRNAWGR